MALCIPCVFDMKATELAMDFGECWLSIMGKMKGGHIQDDTRKAQLQIDTTIDDLTQKEEALRTEMANIAVQVKAAQMSKNKARLNQLVLSSAAKRKSLNMTSRKRLALEHQREAIAVTQLNQQVLSSMKQTSTVLKEMGLSATINTSDEVMMDLQESHTELNELQDTLSSSFTAASDDMSDDALQEELALLLGDDTSVNTMVATPVMLNSIDAQKTEHKNYVTISDDSGKQEVVTVLAPEPYTAQVPEASAA